MRIVKMIHDALWIEAPQAEAETVRALVRTVMSEAGVLDVPREVDLT